MQNSESSSSACPMADMPGTTLPSLVQVQAHQWSAGGGAGQAVSREVSAEVPVAMVFNGISHAVMMASPRDLVEFGVGFAISEGIVESPEDCRDVETEVHGAGTPDASCAVHMEIASRHFARLKDQRRTLAGRTGCGVCGIDSIQALDLHPEQVPSPAWRDRFGVESINAAFSALSAKQALNARSGSLHAAGWARPDGTLEHVMEDVGRHNALDKLIGKLALARELGTPGFVVMTSRTSYELVRKCARVGIPALATISAPTSLALQLADEAGMQLWGFCRPPSAVRYV
ncbi:formate dehydrogenase accessory sulfurtransferase FdhD [Diaphorobacter caeni]|uniref:formate dehydrogenase accessory sulfurtransferase FdhD n=1 Tax=Diaphorobacter caeni TaxID=2784387 RepID=UPI001E5A56BE|nr:formate dehydrogenase accessory sulfurtransferase FdhD [Diaphorobacter caeni]